MTESPPKYLSTAEAARLLGLSTTLVQSLVDRNELKGWKTRGGHRRIALQSIQDYQSQWGSEVTPSGRLHRTPRVMVVVESEQLPSLQRACGQWGFAVDVQFVDSVSTALLDLATEHPDMLVVEMAMPRHQQEKTLQALDHFNARSGPISMVLVTEEKGLQLPPNAEASHLIQVVAGPLSELWLHAYLTGVMASCRQPG